MTAIEEVPISAKSPKFIQTKDKKLHAALERTYTHQKESKSRLKDAEVLLTAEAGYLEAEGLERTFKFTQHEIAEHLDLASRAKTFDLKLDQFGPYSIDYTRNGRHLLIGGKKGHLATFDWKSGKLGCEIHLKETVRDVKWLHNETMFAVAQKKYVYIYDNSGLELHRLHKHTEVNRLEFLPYHFLLASIGEAGYLKYQDTSTGKVVAEHRTKLGKCNTMTQNPWNAVIHLGHSNGTVTFWSPNMTTPLVKMLCHKGPVTAIAIDHAGRYMATSGLDGQLKLWDVRKFTPLQQYYTPTPASCLSISQRGLLGVGWGPHVSIWKDAFLTKQLSPYMNHLQSSSQIQDLQFCPFEDTLGFGHSRGITSIVIPGAGEPNYDSLEVNPYQTKRQRQEMEVHSLLEKIQPEMITLNPNVIGSIDKGIHATLDETRQHMAKANNEPVKERNKMRGRNRAAKRYLKKQANIIDSKKLAIQERLEKEKLEREKKRRGESLDEPKTALDRFSKKRKV